MSDCDGKVQGLPIHVVSSPGWAELQVGMLSVADDYGRPWRVTLLNRPVRLGHVVAVHWDDEQDVVGHMLRYVDSFGPQPMQRRQPERPVLPPASCCCQPA